MNANAHSLVFDRRRGMLVAVAESARCTGKTASGRARAAGLPRLAMAAFVLTATAAAAQSLPSGGVIVRGSGAIEVKGDQMLVRQDTARLVTDWTAFSIGAGAAVRFQQPSADAVALNRVLGNDPSTILGALSSNGHVYLQNPNGVLFGAGARVDVGSLVATTLNADLAAFMAGQLRLSADRGAPGAVVNEGAIVAAEGGHVVLAGPRVVNDGSIVAPGGRIGLAAGHSVTVDATGAGLLDIRVPVAAVGASLANRGRLVADGGQISLQAAAADAARRTVMQVDGVLRAQRIENRGGQIVLAGGASGGVQVGAAIDASSANGSGGQIQVLGERVALVGQAQLDASGAAGGGSVLVGGNLQGQGPQANAHQTVVGRDVVIDASATLQGDGGRVIVWADGHTAYAGQILATGGTQGGDGGFAEVSGKQTLDFQGGADLRAASGRQGLLLLDPAYITVGTTANLNGVAPTGDDLVDNIAAGAFPGQTSQITAARVAQLLASTSVSLQATQGIDVTAPVSVAAGGAASTLTLDAPSVSIASPMSLNNAALVVTTAGGFSDSVVVSADIRSQRSVAISASDISLNSGTLAADSVTLRSTSSGSGSLYQASAHTITANQVLAGESGAAFSSASLYGSANGIRAVSFAAGGSATLNNANSGYRFSLGGSASSLAVTAVSGITQSSPLSVGALTLVTTDTSAGTGDVALSHASNSIGTLGFSVAGGIDLQTAGALTVSSFTSANESTVPVAAGGSITLRSGGQFTMTDSITSTGSSGTPLVQITGAGFNNSGNGQIIATGGRFTIRSSLSSGADTFGAIGFGSGASNINHIVFAGYPGAEPTSGNVFVTASSGRLVINPADLGGVSKVYDGTTGMSLSGSASGNASGIWQTSSGDVALQPISSYSVTLSGNFDSRHAGDDKGFTLQASRNTVASGSTSYYGLQVDAYTRTSGDAQTSRITPLTTSVSGLSAANKVYDTTTAATLIGTASITTLAGDVVSVGGTPVASFGSKQVGNGKPVSVSGLSLAGPDAGNYSLSPLQGLSASITQALLTLTGLSALDKVYDGTVVATLTGTPMVSPLGSDLVQVIGSGAGAFSSKQIGVGKAVSVSGFALSGADAGNYTLALPPGLSATITPATLRLTGTVADKVYDGSAAATLVGAPTVSAFGADTVTVAGAGSLAFGDKNVGSAKPVSASGFTLGGSDAANYLLDPVFGATAAITPRPITLTGLTALDKVYDATTTATLTGTAQVSALAGDVLGLTGSAVGNFADKNVGVAKPVALTGFVLGGADAGNYALLPPSTLVASITPRTIAPAGIAAVDRIFDGTTRVELDASQARVQGVLAGDTVSLLTGSAFGVVASPDPGPAKPVTFSGLALAGTDAANYRLDPAPFVGGATVTLIPTLRQVFESVRFTEYLQGVSDAQEPFRRAMAEALAAGFGKENIRKRLSLGLVFETGLAAPAIDRIQPAQAPARCTVARGSAGLSLTCP